EVFSFQIGELNNIKKNLPFIKNLKPEQIQQQEYQPFLPYTKARDQKEGWIVEIGQIQLVSLFLKQNEGMFPTLFLRGGRVYYLRDLLQNYTGSLLLSPVLEYEAASEILRSSVVELAKPGRQIGLLPEREDLNSLEQFRLDGATLTRFGYPRQEVLSGMTFYNAKILQMEKEVGSLDRGKRANFLVFNGDPYQITSQLKAVYLDGDYVNP
ncbi:MAG: amidohydrolase family protein, partial [Planctomycetota bacterium]